MAAVIDLTEDSDEESEEIQFVTQPPTLQLKGESVSPHPPAVAMESNSPPADPQPNFFHSSNVEAMLNQLGVGQIFQPRLPFAHPAADFIPQNPWPTVEPIPLVPVIIDVRTLRTPTEPKNEPEESTTPDEIIADLRNLISEPTADRSLFSPVDVGSTQNQLVIDEPIDERPVSPAANFFSSLAVRPELEFSQERTNPLLPPGVHVGLPDLLATPRSNSSLSTIAPSSPIREIPVRVLDTVTVDSEDEIEEKKFIQPPPEQPTVASCQRVEPVSSGLVAEERNKRKQPDVDDNDNFVVEDDNFLRPPPPPNKKKRVAMSPQRQTLKVKISGKKRPTTVGKAPKRKQKEQEVFDVGDSTDESDVEQPSTAASSTIRSASHGQKSAAHTIGQRFPKNSRMEPLTKNLERVKEKVKLNNPPQKPTPLINARETLRDQMRQRQQAAQKQRSKSVSSDAAQQQTSTSAGTSAASSRGFNAKIVNPSMDPLPAAPRPAAKPTALRRSPAKTTSSAAANLLKKRFAQEPIVHNSVAANSRASVASQYARTRHNLDFADRISKDHVAQRHVKERVDAAASGMKFKRPIERPHQGQPPAQTESSAITADGYAHNSDDEDDEGLSSSQMGRLEIEKEHLPPQTKRSRLSVPGAQGRFDIDSLVKPKGPVVSFDNRLKCSYDQPYPDFPCTSRSVAVASSMSRPPIRYSTDSPSSSTTAPMDTDAAETVVASASPERLLGPVVPGGNQKGPAKVIQSLFRGRSNAEEKVKHKRRPVPPTIVKIGPSGDVKIVSIKKINVGRLAVSSVQHIYRMCQRLIDSPRCANFDNRKANKMGKDKSGGVEYFETFLTWKYEWLERYRADKENPNVWAEPPKCFPKAKFDQMVCLRNYTDFHEYEILHMGLKTYEVFEEACKKNRETSREAEVISVTVNDETKIATVQLKVVFSRSTAIGDHWLARIQLDNFFYVGVVNGITKTDIRVTQAIPAKLRDATLKRYPDPSNSHLTLISCRMILRDSSSHPLASCSAESFSTSFVPMFNLVPAEREISALGCLREHPLRQIILSPQLENFVMDETTPVLSSKQDQLNASQLEVVNCVVTDIFLRDVPKIGLIHGPPGSGKSHVIVSILEETQERKSNAGMSGKLVLVTAPSNAAIESLATHLQRRRHAQKPEPYLKFVCVGNGFEKGTVAFRYSVDELARKSYLQPPSTKTPVSICAELKRLEGDLKDLKAKAEDPTTGGDMKKQIEQRMNDLESDRKRIQSGTVKRSATPSNYDLLSPSERMASCKNHILGADVVLCTLNSSGLSWLDDLLSQVDENGDPILLAVIVDEACQATELETLIPLRWGTQKIYLVGDPKQLEPTVQSPVCKKKRYDKSMFARFYDACDSPLVRKPVKLLNIQYRMVPEIAAFPSKRFYDEKLLNDSRVRDSCPPELKQMLPYAFIDVKYGTEEHKNYGFMNKAEIDVVVALVNQLRAVHSTANIGVITFYNDQLEQLRAALRHLLYGHEGGVEVNTVDGYQGREKSIVILSCVRAPEQIGGRSRTIGFLVNSKRLNVAITRAKHILYVVGHRDSLDGATSNSASDWKALLDDASDRSLIRTLNSENDINLLPEMLRRPDV